MQKTAVLKAKAVKNSAPKKAKPKTTSTPKKADVELEVTESPTTTGGTKKPRQTPTRESVISSFDELVEMVNTEIQHLRESPVKTKGIKFLRSLNKRVKTLRGHTIRVMKQKQKNKTDRKVNKNSGFLKPVKISKDLAKFTGWDEDQLRSRVEVTKYICNYISEHDLQNPADRRQIRPDAKLQKLLGYNPKKTEEPLRYYSLQTHLKTQNHFPKPPVEK